VRSPRGCPRKTEEEGWSDEELRMLGAQLDYNKGEAMEEVGRKGRGGTEGGVEFRGCGRAPEAGGFWGEAGPGGGPSEPESVGIPMFEWLSLAKPARYLGNEFGAVHKELGGGGVRFEFPSP